MRVIRRTPLVIAVLWLIGAILLGASPAPREHQAPIAGEARSETMTTAGPAVTLDQAASATVVSSTFNSDRDSWTGGTFPDGGPYDQVVITVTPGWHATAGNPGGAIYLDDPDGWTSFFGAPAAYLGNKGTYYGGWLRFDLRLEGTGFVFDQPDVILLGGGLVLVYNHATDPSSTWSSTSVPLTEAGWRINTLSGSVPTREQFESALTNITALRIRGEFINGADTGYLDNVSLSPPVTLSPSPAALNFGAVNNGGTLTSVTPPQVVTVQPSSSAAAAWTASANVPWLTVAAADAAGMGPGRFTVSLNNSGGALPAAGTLHGTITITAPAARSNPTIPVTVTTYPPTWSAAPFGQVDTPVQHANGVQGAIGVTGWALHGVEVKYVDIYRDCMTANETGLCQWIGTTAGGQYPVVYIGRAAFVEGARPDVEAAHPTYPLAQRAGWGYLLLTNMLPDFVTQQPYGGQGTVNLYAFAQGSEGTTLLGRTAADHSPTTITMNNDAIAKPFGAIDTPGQGETISGSAFANFGWVLTRDSNTTGGEAGDVLIPTNGSTAVVFIDGLPRAQVSYNQCRGNVGNPVPAGVYCNDDVSNIFGNPAPQATFTTRTLNPTRYRNLDAGRGAIGAYVFDTTTYANGMHSIAWGVTDSAGVTEGIGSRNFTVLNTGADARRDSGFGVRDSAAAPQPDMGPAGRGLPVRDSRSGASVVLSERPVDGGRVFRPGAAVRGRVGFDLRTPLDEVLPDEAGVRHVRFGDQGRLELHVGAVTAGNLLANGERRDLPVGSHLDLATGVFTWAPVPGYLGTYRLEFVHGSGQTIVDVTVGARAAALPGESQIRMALDVPVDGAVVSGPLHVAGWALDPDAWNGNGIGTVHVWAVRKDVPSVPVFLGAATLGVERLDVARDHGPQFGRAGFALTGNELPRGDYDITAYVWNKRTSRWEDARTAQISVR